jgi:dihydrofolate reductase
MEAVMKLVVGTFLTLDGVMQGPGGPEEDKSGGFAQGGWLVPYFEDKMGQVMVDWINRGNGLLLGRKTYEIFASYWPHVTGDDPIAKKFNSERKHVVSRTLDRVDWNNSTLVKGDVVEAIRRLKAQAGDELQIHGSGDLIQTLLKHNLIDEFRLWTFPIVLGTGKRLFANGTVPARFELSETKTSSTGVTLEVLRFAGTPEYGSFEQPPAEEIERRRKVAEIGG